MTATAELLRQHILAAFPHWPAEEIEIRPLTGGITNHNALVSVASLTPRRFVVRLPGVDTALLSIDRRVEAATARLAADLGIGPPVIGELADLGTMVTEFVEGVHLDDAQFRHRVADVVALLRVLHDSGVTLGSFPIHRVVEWHARDAASRGVDVPAEFANLHALSSRIEAAFAASPDPPVLCHNDLLPGNVLFATDRAWLLDFEYAGMNDRYFDLANLSINCGFDDDVDRSLLERYFGSVTGRGLARLALMKVMSEFREAMWAVVQQAISTLDTDFVAYAGQRFASAAGLMRTMDIEAQLRAASLLD